MDLIIAILKWFGTLWLSAGITGIGGFLLLGLVSFLVGPILDVINKIKGDI